MYYSMSNRRASSNKASTVSPHHQATCGAEVEEDSLEA